jgi:phage shock protein A
MSTESHLARQAVHDKIESQIKIAHAKLETLKARAASAKADVELKLIGDLLTRKPALDQKLHELRTAADDTGQQMKAAMETRVAELEKSIHAIEAKLKVK